MTTTKPPKEVSECCNAELGLADCGCRMCLKCYSTPCGIYPKPDLEQGGEHSHKIALDENGKRIMNDDGWYLCECGAKTFPNCPWSEPKPSPSDPVEEKDCEHNWIHSEDETELWCTKCKFLSRYHPRKELSGSVDSKDEKPSVSPSGQSSKPTDPQIAPSEEWKEGFSKLPFISPSKVYGSCVDAYEDGWMASKIQDASFIKSLLSSSNEKARREGEINTLEALQPAIKQFFTEYFPEEDAGYLTVKFFRVLNRSQEEL